MTVRPRAARPAPYLLGNGVGVLALPGAALVALTWAGLALHVPGADSVGSIARTNGFVALMALAGIAYLAAIRLVLRRPAAGRASLGLVLLVAAAMRLPLLGAYPFLSSDLFRYVWDGEVQTAGINPYRYIPADPALAKLRDPAIYPHVNRRDYAPTIYPPAAQMVFAIVARLSRTPLAMKLAMVAFEAMAMLAMLRLLAIAGLPPARLLIYAWNPLAAWCFAGNGHIDAAAIGFIALALWARGRKRHVWAGAALGAAVLIKFLPVAIAPALWRRWDRRLPLAFMVTVVLLYLPYLGVGRKVLGFLPGYGGEEGIEAGGGIWLLAGIGELMPLPEAAAFAYLGMIAFALICLAAWIVFRPRPAKPEADVVRIGSDAAILAACVIAAISPHYPWYFVWLALPACLRPWRSVVWLSVAPLMLYLDPLHERFIWASLVYVPALVLAAVDLRDAAPGPMLPDGTIGERHCPPPP